MTRVTPEVIESLEPGEVFVFGSNAAGMHGGGAAAAALRSFGAVWGQGHGLQGQSYAIDTMSGFGALGAGVETFREFAGAHPELTFLVTPVGCGVAGYTTREVAPLFAGMPSNVVLPVSFQGA